MKFLHLEQLSVGKSKSGEVSIGLDRENATRYENGPLAYVADLSKEELAKLKKFLADTR